MKTLCFVQVKFNESRVFMDFNGTWKCVHFHKTPVP